MNLAHEIPDLVRAVAARYLRAARSAPDRDDLLQAGCVGYLEAERGFDPSRGVKFVTYASPRVRGAILDHLRRADHLSRSHRAKVGDGGPRLRALPADPSLLRIPSVEDAGLAAVDAADELAHVLRGLDARRRYVLLRSLGHEESLCAIGMSLGLSGARCRQLRWAALRAVAWTTGQRVVACALRGPRGGPRAPRASGRRVSAAEARAHLASIGYLGAGEWLPRKRRRASA